MLEPSLFTEFHDRPNKCKIGEIEANQFALILSLNFQQGIIVRLADARVDFCVTGDVVFPVVDGATYTQPFSRSAHTLAVKLTEDEFKALTLKYPSI